MGSSIGTTMHPYGTSMASTVHPMGSVIHAMCRYFGIPMIPRSTPRNIKREVPGGPSGRLTEIPMGIPGNSLWNPMLPMGNPMESYGKVQLFPMRSPTGSTIHFISLFMGLPTFMEFQSEFPCYYNTRHGKSSRKPRGIPGEAPCTPWGVPWDPMGSTMYSMGNPM